MTESEKVLHVLREARRLVARPGGWSGNERTLDFKRGVFCVDSAVAKACLMFGGNGAWPSVWDWNDAPGRTQAEVVALFDRAIEDATAEVVADRLLARFEKAVTP